MIDFEKARRGMVDGQVRVNDVTDPAIIAALSEIPREKFVPDARASLAYIDDDLCVWDAKDGNPARYLMEPMVFAKLLQAMQLSPSDTVLDVGCATGYSSAVLSKLAGRVTAVEENPDLIKLAEKNLRELGVSNVTIVRGALADGASADAPYDAILLNGSVERVPESLLGQLRDGGRLCAVIRKDSAARAAVLLKTGENVSLRRLFDAAVPPLPGFEAPKTFVF